jgi:L-aspartate oxidase
LNTYRYLKDFDTDKIEKEYHDIIIIGSGIAGVYTALIASEQHSICIVTKESIDISNSSLAQGGIAVSLGKEDSPELHFKDTINAGAGLCDQESVWVLVKEASDNVRCLCQYGVNFDRNEKYDLSLSREAAHSKNRIIHAGDTTGKEVLDKLIAVVREKKNVLIKERHFAVDILTEDNSCRGILVYDEDKKEHKILLSQVVICATGGFGQIYKNTTNPDVATGDGVCLAYRAGAELMDLEFIQFHPTVLYHPNNKQFLISEAVRGEGALLKNVMGDQFMLKYHPLMELAPRDVVSRSIFEEMKNTLSQNVFLDVTLKSEEYLRNRFPNIYKTCMEYGIDISKDMIPVSPAEHYCMGGIKTDVFGRTSITGFYACGEAACNGIHGANRLASNSLLEGLVFGYKIGDEINNIFRKNGKVKIEVTKKFVSSRKYVNINKDDIRGNIQSIMTEYVGISRRKKELNFAYRKIIEYLNIIRSMENNTSCDYELQNMVLISFLVVKSALEREESRGAHFRSDFPAVNNEKWKKNIIRIIKEE